MLFTVDSLNYIQIYVHTIFLIFTYKQHVIKLRPLITSAFFAILLFLVIPVIAQNDNDQYDFTTWWHIELDLEVHEKFKIEIKESIRLKNNSKQINNIFTDVTFKYEPAKFFEIASGFRFIQAKKKKDYQFDFRHNVDLSFKHKAEDFKFKHRIRYTNKNELGLKISEGDEVNHELRLLTELSYKIPKCKLSPFLNAELFYRFEAKENSYIEKIRLKLGADYEFKKAGSIGFFIGYERLFHEEELNNVSILGLSYNYGIKTWKKKKSNS